jgi:tetratricopeptide (TPR) repeat protein
VIFFTFNHCRARGSYCNPHGGYDDIRRNIYATGVYNSAAESNQAINYFLFVPAWIAFASERLLKMGTSIFCKSTYRTHDARGNVIPDEIKKQVDAALSETNRKNYAAAIAIYSRMVPKYPDIEIVRNNLGCCLAEIGKFDEAETEFVEALRITKSKRDKGIYVPRSFPKEPIHNLIKLYKCVTKHLLRGRQRPRNIHPANRGTKENTVQKLVRIIKRDGIISVIKKIPLYLQPKLNSFHRWHDKVIALRAEEFDRNCKIDTAGALFQSDFGTVKKNQSHARYYLGSDALAFHNALSSLKIAYHEYTFIDFGSGKGKALFLASGYPFKKIIGIEFSEVLDAIAQENIRHFNKDNIEAYCMDAVDYKIPEESLICYFYDPFDDYIMARVISNMRQAYEVWGKNIIIIYNNTRLYDLFDSEKWLEKLPSIGPIMMWSSKNNIPSVR